MSLLWELSTDSVVTALIVVCISSLATAWLFAGRRRPVKTVALEQRRLAGREADVFVAPAEPFEVEPLPEPASGEASDDILAAAPQIEAPLSSLQEASELQHNVDADDLLSSQEAPQSSRAPTQPPPPVEAAPTARSAEQASAISIAAALVRHDKREVALSKPPAPELPLANITTGGDDLTVINNIDRKLAKELNDLGIRYFDQIVDWSPDHAAWVTSRLSTPVTNAQRTAWIAEAKALTVQSAQAARIHAERAG